MVVTYHSIESKADDDVTKMRYEEGRKKGGRKAGTGTQVNHLSTMVLIQPFSYRLVERKEDRKEETAQQPWRDEEEEVMMMTT